MISTMVVIEAFASFSSAFQCSEILAYQRKKSYSSYDLTQKLGKSKLVSSDQNIESIVFIAGLRIESSCAMPASV